MRALEKNTNQTSNCVTRSISPTNYDNGYAPRTVRLFSLVSKNAPAVNISNRDYDSSERIKVNGKMTKVDKDNIFKTLGKQQTKMYEARKN